MSDGDDAPFREPPLEARVRALREERDALHGAREQARARAPLPWSWGRFALGLATGVLGPPCLLGTLVFVAHRLWPATPPPAPAPAPLPASYVAGGSPARCRTVRCEITSVRPGETYECAASSLPSWDGGRADRISWNAGTCSSGHPCEPGQDCLVFLADCNCSGTCE